MIEPPPGLPLETVAQRLELAGIPWAVFAGAAATAYGVTRPLTDVDILVPRAEGARVVQLFPEAGVKRWGDGSVEAILLPGYDILPGLPATDLDDEMLTRLRYHEIAGVTVPVIPPEDNILLKARLGRGPEVGKHDWEDIEAMVAHSPALDWKYLRWRADVYLASEAREQILGRLENLWHQRR